MSGWVVTARRLEVTVTDDQTAYSVTLPGDDRPPLIIPRSTLEALAAPRAGPFSVGDTVSSPRAPEYIMAVEQVGPIDFQGVLGYFCRPIRDPELPRWFREDDLALVA